MKLREFLNFNFKEEALKIESGDDTESKAKELEIKAITPEKLEEIAYLSLDEGLTEIEVTLSEQENNECLQEIIGVYENFPEEIKRLFRFKARGIYYMPGQYKKWSGHTCQSKEEHGKSVIILNAKAVKVRHSYFVLTHELGHVDDFETYPPAGTPKWAWEFIDKFEKEILKEEPSPIEGSNRDNENMFGARREEWASRLAATIISLYLPDQPVTGLAIYPYTAEDFKKSYPRSFKFFKKYLEKIDQEIKTKELK